MEERILLVVAHPDDEVLGFGATGYKKVKQGAKVKSAILCANAEVRNLRPSDNELMSDIQVANQILGFEEPILGSFPNISTNTIEHIKLVQFIEKAIEDFAPTHIFTHHPKDLNIDHQEVSKACIAAARLFQRRSELPPLKMLAYMEIQSATDWAFEGQGDGFRANMYVEIEDCLEKKLEALRCYRNVMRDYPHPRSDEAMTGLAAYRGGQAGQRYSEAFQLIFQQEI